jgi:HipA N-terminal domain
VPTYFAGLLPEGRRLSGLRRAVKTSADDDLTLLLAVGLDPVGDVQIVPAGLHPAPAQPLIEVDTAFEEVSFSEILHAGGVIDPVALAGVQDKASARMMSVPVGRADKRYILKSTRRSSRMWWRTRPISSGARPWPTSRLSARAPSKTGRGALVCWCSVSTA